MIERGSHYRGTGHSSWSGDRENTR